MNMITLVPMWVQLNPEDTTLNNSCIDWKPLKPGQCWQLTMKHQLYKNNKLPRLDFRRFLKSGLHSSPRVWGGNVGSITEQQPVWIIMHCFVNSPACAHVFAHFLRHFLHDPVAAYLWPVPKIGITKFHNMYITLRTGFHVKSKCLKVGRVPAGFWPVAWEDAADLLGRVSQTRTVLK